MFWSSSLLGSSLFTSFALLAQPSFVSAALLPTRSSVASDSLAESHDLLRRDPDPSQDAFVNPGPFVATTDYANNTLYAVGGNISVKWISEWQTVDLSLCQPTNGATSGCYTLIRGTLSKGYIWDITNLTDHMTGFQSSPIPNVFFFQLSPTDTANPMIKSEYFTLTKSDNTTDPTGTPSPSPSPSSSSSSSATPSSTTSNSSPLSSTNPSDSTTTDHPSAQVTSGSRVIITVSIVIAIGVAIVLGGIAYWLRRRHLKRKRAAALSKIGVTESMTTLTSPTPLQEMHADSYVHETGAPLPHEAASKEIPMELPAEVPGLAVSSYGEDEVGGWGKGMGRPTDHDRK